MKKLLVLGGAGVLAAALTVVLYPRDTKPGALVRACDVLTRETAESLIGPNSRSNDDNAEFGTQCQYLSNPMGRSVNLSAQRVPARGKADGETRARRSIRSLPGDPAPVTGIGDEAYVHAFSQQGRKSPIPSLGTQVDITVRAGDVLINVAVWNWEGIGETQAAATALARRYLAKIN
jgi:hypothetical protein